MLSILIGLTTKQMRITFMLYPFFYNKFKFKSLLGTNIICSNWAVTNTQTYYRHTIQHEQYNELREEHEIQVSDSINNLFYVYVVDIISLITFSLFIDLINIFCKLFISDSWDDVIKLMNLS